MSVTKLQSKMNASWKTLTRSIFSNIANNQELKRIIVELLYLVDSDEDEARVERRK